MIAEIGHNSPPVVVFSLHIEELFSLVSGSTSSPITTDEQENALTNLLDDVRRAKTDAEAQRIIEKRPHDLAAAEVQKAWKPLIDRCDAAASAIKASLTPYRTAKQRAKDEAARTAREEAEARQKAAQDALRASEDLAARFAAEQQLELAAKQAAQAARIERAPTGLRASWEAEIVDRGAALRHYIAQQPEMFVGLIQELADKDARNEATRRDIPGIRFNQIRRAA